MRKNITAWLLAFAFLASAGTAGAADPAYVFIMKSCRVVAVPVIAALAIGVAAGAQDGPRAYTSEDLDRMFGPAPKSPSESVDKSGPEDWRFVEQFLDRQYVRIEADRANDLNRRAVDIAERRVAPANPYRYGGVAWGLGYPASTWWQNVWSAYSGVDADGERHHHGWRSQLPTVSSEPRREPLGRGRRFR